MDSKNVFIGKGLFLGIVVSQVLHSYPLLAVFLIIGIMSYYSHSDFTNIVNRISSSIYITCIYPSIVKLGEYDPLGIFLGMIYKILNVLYRILCILGGKITKILIKWGLLIEEEIPLKSEIENNKSVISKDLVNKIENNFKLPVTTGTVSLSNTNYSQHIIPSNFLPEPLANLNNTGTVTIPQGSIIFSNNTSDFRLPSAINTVSQGTTVFL